MDRSRNATSKRRHLVHSSLERPVLIGYYPHPRREDYALSAANNAWVYGTRAQ